MMMYFPSLPRSHHLILLVFLIFICGQNYAATPYTNVFSLLLLPFPRSRYCSQHPVFKHCQCMFVHDGDRPSFTPYKARGKITLFYIVIFNFYWDLFNKLTIFQPCSIDCRMIDWSRIEKDLEGSRYGLIKLLSHHFLEENIFSYSCCMCYMFICRLWNF